MASAPPPQPQTQPDPPQPQTQPDPPQPPPQLQHRRERPVSKRELDHLVDIKIDDIVGATPERRNRVVLREALVEWKEQVEAFDAKVEKRTKRTDQLTTEIYQLVGLYSVFVGVVFTAVLQSSRVQCQHIWSPIVLCGVAYLVLLVIIIKKSKQIDIDRTTIQEDEAFRKRRVEHIRILKSEGPSKFDFGHPKFENLGIPLKGNSEASSRPLWIIFILTFFTLVLLVSFVHILCINTSSSCNCAPAH